MSDKSLNVDEIMSLVADYGASAAVYATTATDTWNQIRAELEKLVQDDD